MSPAEVGEMTMADVEDLTAYWEEHPPTNEVAMIGFEIEVKKKPSQGAWLSPEELKRMVGEINRR